MDQATVRMDEGATARLRVLVTESDGRTHELSGSGVTWTVRDADIASVDAGLVKAQRPGVTQVIATAGGTKTATAELVVLAVPGSVEILTGDRQVGTVGKALLSPIRLQVLGRDGRPLQNTELQITPIGPGGTVSPANPRTNEYGMVEVQWTLGTRAGAQAADVQIAGRAAVVGVVSSMAVPGSVAKIEVTPSDALVTPGGHIRFAAVALDQYGNPVPDAVLQWGVQDSLVAMISQDGVARARTEGETAVEARYIAPTSAALGGQGPPDTRGWGRFKSKKDADVPEQVNDLYSPSQATSSVALAFTQVGDGTGDPADYEVRYLPSPLGSNFDGAMVARTGSCTSPIVGTAIGARLTCTVEGLESGRSYDFQIVSFRGVMGAGEVRGPVSNVVTARTSETLPGSIEIAGGDNQSATVGNEVTSPIVVRVKSATGGAMSNVTVLWTVTSGGGTVSSTETRTNSLGLAETRWRLGTVAGTNTVKASVGTLNVTFTATGKAPTSGPASIRLSPTEKTIRKGEAYQLTAEARDAQGNLMPNAVLNWSSSDATHATVSSSGMVYGIDAGSATIRASSGGAEGMAAIAVQSTAGGYPADVNTLAMVSTTSHSATIRFTEVDDGTGKPADYSVRYHLSPIGWNWDLATRVTDGSCAALKGSAIGNVRTCVVEGLSAGTKYDFQLVAHRTDPDGSLVLSERLSNIVTGTTLASTSGKLTISPRDVILENVGSTLKLTATATATDGSPIYSPGIVWTSANPSIASIDSNGMLTARGIGVVAITAAATCCTADTIMVSVKQTANWIGVEPRSLSLAVGQSSRITATVKDGNGQVVSNADVTWHTYDANIATIAADGTVSAKKAGTVSVYAKYGTLAAAAPVTVTSGSTSAASIAVSPSSMSLGVGKTGQAAATVRDANGNVVSGASITWETLDSNLATVSSTGLVTARNTGVVSIIARSGDLSAALPVTITSTGSGSGSMSVDPTSVSLTVGDARRATATVRDGSGNIVSGATVTWESQNTGVATVRSDGTITAIGSGSTSIVARSGTLSATVAVAVRQPDTAPVPGGSWAHEPAGWTLAVDEPMNERLLSPQPAGNWGYGNGFETTSMVSVQRRTDGNSLRWTYPAGFEAGASPGRVAIGSTSMQFTEIYIGILIRWSTPWAEHFSGANKILYWGSMETRESLGWGPTQYYLNRRVNYIDITVQQSQGNIKNVPGEDRFARTPIDDGQWHRVELILKGNSAGQLNCRAQLWVDGVLNFDTTGFGCALGDAVFYGMNLDPVWGGVGGVKPQTDWLEIDHVRMSGRLR